MIRLEKTLKWLSIHQNIINHGMMRNYEASTYVEIPYDVIYDEEVLSGVLPLYDWLHLHHEDFTGQYGKFYKF